MVALCFKYFDVAIQIHNNKMADSPIMPDICISLKRAGSAIEQIIPLVRKKATQHTQDCPAKKHDTKYASEPEQPMFTLLCCWLCLYLLRWLLSGWWWFVVNNDAFVAALNNLNLGCC